MANVVFQIWVDSGIWFMVYPGGDVLGCDKVQLAIWEIDRFK